MDRPCTSHGLRDRRSFSALWRPKTGVDRSQHPHQQYHSIGVMTSNDSVGQDRLTTNPFDSFEHSTDSDFTATSDRSDRPDLKTSEKVATQGKRLVEFLTRRGNSEERRTLKQSQSTSWLRRARSTRFLKSKADHEEPQVILHNPEELREELSETSMDLGFVHGGAGARAAAAASRDRITRVKEDLAGDSESGIGIEVKDLEDSLPDASTLPRLDPACLPPELFEHIISHLDSESVTQAELVSIKWHETASSYRVWRGIFGTEFRRRKSLSQIPSHVGGMGLGSDEQEQSWKEMWKARKALNSRWKSGHAAAIYLEGHKDSVYCVQFDENKIITGSRDRTIRVWDAQTYECIRVLGIPKSSPEPRSSTPIGNRMNRQKPFHSVYPTQTSPVAVSRSINHQGSILCLQFDETTMVTGSSDTTLIVWNIKADYQPVFQLHRHTAGVLDVCFDDDYIVSCSKDTTVCLWERSTGALLRTFTGHGGPVNAVQLRGSHIVSASGDGIAKLWNITTGNCVKEFPSKDRGMACVEFSPDSRMILAGGNDQVIYHFDANTGELVRELSGHQGLVRSLHLDSVNGRVISGSYDYSVKAFDVATGEMVCDFAGWTTSWMLSAKADYRRIVSTSQDGRAVVMDFGWGLKGVELLKG